MEIAFLVMRVLLSAALYAFLGWALWLLWQRIRLQVRALAEAPSPSLTLRLAEISSDPAAESTFVFTRPEIIVGRQPGSDLHLDDSAISARHARLTYHHGQWWIEDLRSKNGTYLNQERISSQMVLTSGDELRFGGVALLVHVASSGASAAESGL